MSIAAYVSYVQVESADEALATAAAAVDVPNAEVQPSYVYQFNLTGQDADPLPGVPGVMSDPFLANVAGRVDKIDTTLLTISGDIGSIKASIDGLKAHVDTRIDSVNDKLKHFPTKLQLALWGLGAMALILVATWQITATLLDHAGAKMAAEVAKAVAGK